MLMCCTSIHIRTRSYYGRYIIYDSAVTDPRLYWDLLFPCQRI